MPSLADIYSAINTAKRKGADFVQNPGTSLQQMLGNANDSARALNEQDRATTDEFLATRKLNGPLQMQSAMDMAGAYNPVGMVSKTLAAKYPNVALGIGENPTSLNLAKIVVPPEMRNQGVGSSVMKDLIQYADETGKQINLSPSADFGGSPTRLKKFYKEFGFQDNRGKSRDFSTTETMVRPPVQVADDLAYRGEHSAPTRDFGAPLHDLTGGGQMYPADVYSPQAAQYYGGGVPYDSKAFSIAQQYKNKPDALVTIYRAVPKELSNSEALAKIEKDMAAYMRRKTLPKDAPTRDGSAWYDYAFGERERLRNLPDEPVKGINNINAGDWVTLTKEYAKDHGDSALKGNYKILSKKVKAKDIYTNADSIHEFGYDPSK
jgi:GNAT superfamily N-acetyltransferase